MLRHVSHDYDLIEKETLPVMHTAKQIKINGLSIIALTQDICLSSAGIDHPGQGDDEEEEEAESLQEKLERLSLLKKAIQKDMETYTSLVDAYFPNEAKFPTFLLPAIEQLSGDSDKLVSAVVQQADNEDYLLRRQNFTYSKDNFFHIINTILEHEDEELLERQNLLKSRISHSKQLVLLTFLAIFCFALCLGFLTSIILTHPLKKLEKTHFI